MNIKSRTNKISYKDLYDHGRLHVVSMTYIKLRVEENNVVY